MKKRAILQRNRGNKQLEDALEYPLTMIVAPMGFGKTTAVKAFLENVRGKHIWLTIHQDEESPQLLWNLVVDQIARGDPKFGEQLHQMGFPLNQLQQNKVFRLIEKYSANERIIIVIDDYHHVKSEAFDQFIEMLIRHRIANVSLIVVSRSSLNLQVDDLELKGFCKIIDSDVWLMTKEEIKALLSINQVFPSKSMIDQIYERSEGWITAVHLLMHHYIQYGKFEFGSSLERLIENAIAEGLSDDGLCMLMKLSVLGGFTLEQAVHVVDGPDRNAIRSVCEDCGLVMYKHDANGYKFQKMFRVVLNRRFETTFDQAEKCRVHQRAGECLMRRGEPINGLKQLLMAGAYEQILGVLEKPKSMELMENNPKMVAAIFSEISEELKLQFPIAYIKYIRYYLTHINRDDGKQMVKGIESSINGRQDLSPDMWNWIHGEIEMAKSDLEFNNIYKMHDHHKKAFNWLQGISVLSSMEWNAFYGSIHLLYMYHKTSGGLQETANYINRSYGADESVVGEGGAGLADQVMTEFYLETCDFKQAIVQVEKAICKALKSGRTDFLLCARFALIRSYIASGNPELAMESIVEMKVERDQSSRSVLTCSFDLAMGYVDYLLEDERGIVGWLKNNEIGDREGLYGGRGFDYIVAGQSLLLHEEYVKLEMLVEEMSPVFRKFNHIFGYIHGFILDAIAKFHLYGYDAAVGSLESALNYAKEDSVVLPFCEYTRDLYELMEQYQNRNQTDLYVRKVMKAMNQYYDNLKKASTMFGKAIVLTPKEKEIMKLILEGKSNREIATELYLAEITIKKHVSAIYKKLGVKGRTLAVKKCLVLNIL